MKLSLIITLTVAAMSYASPLQSNLNISSSAQTTDHQRMRRYANGCVFTSCGCPDLVMVIYEDSDSGPYKLLQKYYGTYRIQSGNIGGRDWYLSINGKYAIWYNRNYGQWTVGQEHKKGTDWRVFRNNDDDKCPHQPGDNWQYWVPAISKWVDADRGMSIWKKLP